MNKRKGNRNSRFQPTEQSQEMTALKEALLETREGRALVNELQRYKKEVSSYYAKGEEEEEAKKEAS